MKKAEFEDAQAFKAEIAEETVDDWMEKNTRSYQWANHFDLGAPTVLLTGTLNPKLLDEPNDYWKQLHTIYPDLLAVEAVSRVGFNQSRTQAVVLIGFMVGPIGGEGKYVLLEKKNGKWEITHRLGAWLS